MDGLKLSGFGYGLVRLRRCATQVRIEARILDVLGDIEYKQAGFGMKIAFSFLLFLSLTSTAQTRTFTWQDELCTYRGTFDAKAATLGQLRNTLKLASGSNFNLLEFNSTAWKFADIAKLEIAGFDATYKRKTAELRALQIVPVKYFEDLRQAKLREMEAVHRLNRTTMLAYREPKALLEYTDAPLCTTKYANPLIAGGDELLDVWRRVNEDSRINNADPERLRRIYEQQLKSSDRIKFALIEVMNFGWSNCANALIPYIEYDGTPEREFKKLFRSVRKIRCDEP